jgi:hypothetical protein
MDERSRAADDTRPPIAKHVQCERSEGVDVVLASPLFTCSETYLGRVGWAAHHNGGGEPQAVTADEPALARQSRSIERKSSSGCNGLVT